MAWQSLGEDLARDATLDDVKTAVEALNVAVQSGGITQTQLDAIKDAVEALDLDADSLAKEAKQDTQITAEQAIQAAVEGTVAVSEQSPLDLSALATEVTAASIEAAVDADRATVRAIKAEPKPGEQWRRLVEGDIAYHGIAPDGTADSAAWTVIVRLDESTTDQLEIRAQTSLAWDDRATGW